MVSLPAIITIILITTQITRLSKSILAWEALEFLKIISTIYAQLFIKSIESYKYKHYCKRDTDTAYTAHVTDSAYAWGSKSTFQINIFIQEILVEASLKEYLEKIKAGHNNAWCGKLTKVIQ